MKKINVRIEKDIMSFSICRKDVNEYNLNNTNIIDVNNLVFSDLYIVNNIELVAAFVNVVLIKKNIKSVKINNIQISEIIVELIKQIPAIENVYFDFDKQLSYSSTEGLIENKNIKYINCFSIPEVMLGRIKTKKIDFRCEMFFISEFMNVNKIHSYSDIFFKKVVVYNCEFNNDDITDFLFFLKINDKLKLINVINYKKESFENLLKYLDTNNEKAKIVIYEDKQNPENLLKDLNQLRKIKNKKNYDIKIKYSKEYKEKNAMKQINLNLLKLIILTIVIISIALLATYKIVDNKNEKKVNIISEQLDEIIKNNQSKKSDSSSQQEEEKFSYYTNYNKVFSELLKINKDTVGWISVSNTNVDYPVVQSKDNKYYLNHDYKKNKNSSGWIYADYRNNFNELNQNTIIYGHDVLNSEILFSTLKNTLNNNWINNDNNHYITFNTINETMKWKIFSIYTIDVTNDYLITSFTNKSSFESYIEKETNRSIHDFNMKVTSNDKILTLSTCYKDSNHRLVIHAKKV